MKTDWDYVACTLTRTAEATKTHTHTHTHTHARAPPPPVFITNGIIICDMQSNNSMKFYWMMRCHTKYGLNVYINFERSIAPV